MNALLTCLGFPVTCWGLQPGMRLIGKRAALPSLGPLTVAILPLNHRHVRNLGLHTDAPREWGTWWADIMLTGGLLARAKLIQETIGPFCHQGDPVFAQAGGGCARCGLNIGKFFMSLGAMVAHSILSTLQALRTHGDKRLAENSEQAPETGTWAESAHPEATQRHNLRNHQEGRTV